MDVFRKLGSYMREKLTYLADLGYSEVEIEKYSTSWSEGIIEYLADNSYVVYENMKYLQEDFDKDTLLLMPVHYPDSFCIKPERFRNYIEMLKEAVGDDYSEILEKQLWSYEGYDSVYVNADTIENSVLYEPFMEILTSDENEIHESIESLKNPATRFYKFIVMLNRSGIHITPEDVNEDLLLDFELNKWTLVNNADALMDADVPAVFFEDLLWYCPYMAMESSESILNAIRDAWGDNYLQVIEECRDSDEWGEMLLYL